MERKDVAVRQRHNNAESYKTAPTGANPGDRIGNGGVGRWVATEGGTCFQNSLQRAFGRVGCVSRSLPKK